MIRTPSLLIMVLAVLLSGCGKEYQRPVVEFTMGDPVDSGSRYSSLQTDNSGTVFMSWVLKLDESLNALQYSQFDGQNWLPSRAVGVRSDYAMDWISHPTIAAWDGEPVAAQWFRLLPQYPGQSTLQLTFFQPDGRWSPPVSPMQQAHVISSQTARIVALDRDHVLTVWSGLETVIDPDESPAGFIPSSAGNMTIAPDDESVSENTGEPVLRSAIINRDGPIIHTTVIDPMFSLCGDMDLSIGSGTPPMVVYRRGDDSQPTQVTVSSFDKSSGSWSPPVNVSSSPDHGDDCTGQGPRIAVRDNLVGVIWTIQRDDSLQVQLSVSSDGGESFSDPLVLNQRRSLGRPDVAISPEGDLFASWVDASEPFAKMMLQAVPGGDLGGVLSAPLTIGNLDPTTSSGWPEMTISENGIIFSWTQTDPFVRVRNAYVRFDEAMSTDESIATEN